MYSSKVLKLESASCDVYVGARKQTVQTTGSLKHVGAWRLWSGAIESLMNDYGEVEEALRSLVSLLWIMSIAFCWHASSKKNRS